MCTGLLEVSEPSAEHVDAGSGGGGSSAAAAAASAGAAAAAAATGTPQSIISCSGFCLP